MNLVPTVVLLTSDDAARLEPHLARIESALDEQADMLVELMAERGWTPRMIAWSTLLHTFAEGLASGAYQFDVKPKTETGT